MTLTREPTLEDAKLFTQKMCAELRGKIIDKTSAAEMQFIASVFEPLRLLGIKLPSGNQFLNDYATTLGPFIYLPSGWPPRTIIDIVTHEFEHVCQWWHGEFEGELGFGGGINFAYLYLWEPEARVRAEQRAIRAQWEVKHLAFGEPLPLPQDCANILEGGYALSAENLKLALDLAEGWLTELHHKRVVTKSGKFAISVLESMGLS